MNEYQLIFHSVPTINFAHRYDTEKYRIAFEIAKHRMEITYVLQGSCDIIYEEDNESVHVPCNSVFLTIYDRPVIFTGTGYHQHVTVSIDTDYEFVSENGLILPHVLSFETSNNPIRPMLERLVVQYNSELESPLNRAMVWELLGKISSLYLEEKQECETPGQIVYVRRAQRYIHEHLTEPIRVADIAKHLSISTGYLSHLFSQIHGQTLVEYINTVRIQRVEELVLKYGLEVGEAGAQVGLTDPDYTSRLFRRIRGCSLTELRRVRR